LWIADSANQTIRKLVVGSQVVTTAFGTVGTPGSADGNGTAASFRGPVAVTLNSANSVLFVSDSGNGTIRSATLPGGSVFTLAGKAIVPPPPGTPVAPPPSLDASRGIDARFWRPTGIALDPSQGSLFVADQFSCVLRQIELSGTNVVTTPAGTPRSLGFKDGPGSIARMWETGTVATGDGHVFSSPTTAMPPSVSSISTPAS
jgi:hypothetical protein